MGTTKKVPNKYTDDQVDVKIEETKYDENGEIIVK